MTKYSFLNELDELLSGLDVDERREILEDYEEHFAFAKRADKSDAEIIELVGTPASIASEILGQQVEGKTEAKKARELQEEALKAQAKALEEQAATLEAKLAQQAEELAKQAEELAGQTERQEGSFGTQVGSLVDSLTATVGSVVGSVTDAISESFELDSEGIPEDAVHSETLIEEIVDVTGIKNVIIDARNQKVEIEKTVYPTARIRLARGMLSVKVEGDTLYIESRALKRKLTFGSLITIEQTSALEVELPEAIYDLIRAKTVNAKIEIDSFEVEKLDLESSNGKLEIATVKAKELKLKTANGKIEVRNTKGDIYGRTTNGKIELDRIAGDINVKTTNGKIELRDITKDILATTTNGKIEFKNQTIAQNIDMNTCNAKIEIKLKDLPVDAKFELTTSNAKTKLFDTERNYDVFGDGSYEVKLATSNAKIEVSQEIETQK